MLCYGTETADRRRDQRSITMVTPSWAWTAALGWVFSQHSPGWVWVHSVTLKFLVCVGT